ncbi:MAG: undecaprenyldiphospho-muramoylpentapeptide beta-N-acetylglucosaminyltransferase [Polyangiaceae bacterium]|nr:undecaprenyldiphospho-muramoylpentapeptide beta-N-acetylglucosaminyltransferase [Polyangiaceae bacterium]
MPKKTPKRTPQKTIAIAGGGTGGHVFPGLAVAHAVRNLADVRIVFLGSPRGIEQRTVPQHGYELELLDVEPMSGGGVSRAIRGAWVAAKAMQTALAMARRLAPAVVLSVGGYAAGPASLACVLEHVPLAVLETNAVPGLANRLLVPFATRVFTAFPGLFRGPKTRMLGVPLRPGFVPKPYAPREGERRVLVLGGSLGAEALNERVPEAIARAASTITDHVHVLHQAGKGSEAVRAKYNEVGLRDVRVAEFLDDVSDRIAQADVIIARAGAGSVAEITAIGRPTIFVPFPHATADHQAKNAQALAAKGGAICIRQEIADENRLATELVKLLGDRDAASRMADVARAHGRPSAASDIARDLLAMAGIVATPPCAANAGSKELV